MLLKIIFITLLLLTTNLSVYSQTISQSQSQSQPIKSVIANEGHYSEVRQIDICANGRFAISQAEERDDLANNPIKLWDLATARLLKNLPGVDYTLSPDKNTLYLNQRATNLDNADLDNTLIIIELSSLTQNTAKNYKYRINQISANGKFALSYDFRENTIQNAFIFELESGKKIIQLPGKLLKLTDDFSLALLQIDQETKIYDIANKNWRVTLPNYSEVLALSPSGNHVILKNKNLIQLLNLETNKSSIEIKDSQVWKTAFSKDSKYLAILLHNLDLQVYSSLGKLLKTIKLSSLNNININDSEIALDLDNSVVVAYEQDRFHFWDFSNPLVNYATSQLAQGYLPGYCRINSQGNLLVCEQFYDEETRELIAWDLNSGKPIKAQVLEDLGTNSPSLSSLLFSDHFIALANKGSFDIYDLALDRRILQVIGKSISFGKNSLLVLQEGRLVLYSLTSSKPIALFQHNQTIRSATISANGRQVAALDGIGNLIVWDSETCKEIFRVENSDNPIIKLILSDTGNSLVTIHTNQVKVWSIAQKRLNQSFSTNSTKITAYLSANENIILLIDKSSGKAEALNIQQALLKPLGKVADSGLIDASISSDGRLASINGVVWDLNMAKPLTKATSGYGTLLANNKVILACASGYEVWDINKNALLATVRDYESAWLVYTPEGFFDGSNDSIRLLSWVSPYWPYLQIPNNDLEKHFYSQNLLSKVIK